MRAIGWTRGWPDVALLAAATLGSACASAPSPPRVVPFPEVSASAERPAGLFTTYSKALDLVLRVMESELGLPTLHGSLRLYPDKESLVAGLTAEGYDAAYARRIADTLDGIGTARGILANDGSLRRQRWPVRIAFLGHELTHVAEYTLAGGRRGISDQWLREGLAEWVSWTVMGSLEMGSIKSRRRTAVQRVREANRRHRLPSFSELLAPRSWVVLSSRQSSNVIYDEAFLAADLLIDTHGLAATLDYFRLVGSSDDHLANFSRAFGEERSSFEGEFTDFLARLLK